MNSVTLVHLTPNMVFWGLLSPGEKAGKDEYLTPGKDGCFITTTRHTDFQAVDPVDNSRGRDSEWVKVVFQKDDHPGYIEL